jgi:medium-chain acyl-[acyl-carrier-protein] hydrolase
VSPTTAEDRWIKVFQPQPDAQLRLFCFPYAGGGASIYRLWPRELPGGVEVCAVQLPGRESRWREEPFRRVEPLADATTEALLGRLERPFAFFGHSMGAILAFEVARRLGRRGLRGPRHLVVSGRSAPRVEIDDPPIRDLPREEFIDAVRRYSGTPEEVLQNRELMELVEPLLRADFSVSETYEYSPDPEPLAVPLTVFGGLRDEEVPPEDLEAWRLETRGPYRKYLIDGGHFFLNDQREEVLRIVARELEPYLR